MKKYLSLIKKKYGISIEKKKISLKFYFNPIYVVYAYKKKPFNYPYYKDALICSLEECKPKYLCNLAIEGYGASLGIGFRGVSFKDQYEAALKQAITNFLYTYESTVDIKEIRKVFRNKLSAFKLRLKNSIVTPHGKIDNLHFLVRSLCLDKEGNLFLYLITPNVKIKKYTYSKPCWINDPNCLGNYVYVGYAKQCIGGLKEQLKIAIKRALQAIAKSKGIKITNYIYKKAEKNFLGSFKIYYEDTKTHSHQIVKATLIGIYKNKDTLYVGLIER